nr:hypothetical protein [Kofleriaceae bacterium]
MTEWLDWACDVMHARGVRRRERLQRLWGGHGELVRVTLDGGDTPTVILKVIAPPGDDSIASTRKRRSYDVEEQFYRRYAPRCDGVAQMFASRRVGQGWWLALEDLGGGAMPLDRCLAWLARFHARFLGDPGDGLWPEGTYWHLATRLDELAIDPARASALDRALASAAFQTLLHGDAKDDNFLAAGAVDFQYAGRGCGMKDVAYLLHGRSDAHLERYFQHLRAAAASDVDVDALEREWRALYPVAQQDFARFLAGWRG